MKKKLLVCVVLYKKEIERLHIHKLYQNNSFDIRFCIFDNSPEYNSNKHIPKNIEYYPQDKNQGIAIPYNLAFKIATNWKAQHILLLDQDTYLEPVFFEYIEKLCIKKYDVILPKVFHEDILISPLQHGIFFKKSIKNTHYQINVNNRILFINSGTTFSIDFLNKIGGFNPTFWLDMQDYWLSLMAYKHQATIGILDYNVKHNLSVMNKGYISIERYKNLHLYESVFYVRYESFFRKIVYLFILVLRYVKRFNYLRKNKFLIDYWKIILD
ncbi:glycosyltransferase [Emticicia sediminis]